MGDLVIESAVCVGFVKLNGAAVEVMDSGASGVPPVGVNHDIAARAAKHSVTLTEKVEASVQLGHASFVLGLKDGEVVDTSQIEAAHGLDAFERAEPVEGKEGFVGTYA